MSSETREAAIMCPIGTCPDCDDARRREQDARCPTRAKRQDTAVTVALVAGAFVFGSIVIGLIFAGVIHG